MRSTGLLRPTAPRRGIATLTVVMVLFFILAMVAAYTNRNLIFEQRTSANSYHAAQAMTATDAGIDWAIAMLNGGRIDANCAPDAAGPNDFRTRYLTLQHDGSFRPKAWPLGAQNLVPTPACIAADSSLTCTCPEAPIPSFSGAVAAATAEAPIVFAVRFTLSASPAVASPTGYPGVLGMQINGCTSIRSGTISAANIDESNSCHRNATTRNTTTAVDGEGVGMISLGLVSALPVVPVAALTVGGDLTQAAATSLRAVNPDANTGVGLRSGGSFGGPGTLVTAGPAGSTAQSQITGDSTLANLAATPADFFIKTFGMASATYGQQPAALRLDCGGGCTAASHIDTAIAEGPTRVIVANGNVTLDAASTYGSTALPVMLVVMGDLTVDAAVTFNGVIYVHGNVVWSNGGTVVGALVTRGNFTGNGDGTFAYDREIVRRIRQSYGSFVRVPGSWRTQPGA